ncbi:MAG TPA: HEAT repeat domain-containing protein [Smithella sp.]|nr:HEAT repeat domain-containing protein [Smithella sp.]
MAEETKQSTTLSPEVNDLMRTLITAIRIVKLYPPNNPVYSQSVKDAHDALSLLLENIPECYIGVQKAFFTYEQTPVGKDTEANRVIAHDLFTKGIRNIIFSKGVTATEMLDLFQALALQAKDLGILNGVASILWEKGASNIKVTEAGLDEIITSDTRIENEKTRTQGSSQIKTDGFVGHTLVLDNLLTDQESFAAAMVALAKETKGENETVEDRLLALYQEAGNKILKENPDQKDALFEALAQSAMSLESPYREALIAGKLYSGLDSENTENRKTETEERVPNVYHEIMTGRFLDLWTVKQVAELLQKLTTKEITPSYSSVALSTISLSSDIKGFAKEIAEYSEDETEALNSISGPGTERDMMDATMRTLIALIPLVKSPDHTVPSDKEIVTFAGIIHQLEEILHFLLANKDYDRVSLITMAFNTPVDPAFKPRMLEALRKTSSKNVIISTITDLQNYAKGSFEYVSAYSYLSAMERETTEALLEMLAKEADNKSRSAILDLLKDFGKKQMSVLGDHLSESSLSFVRDIISILSETKSDQAVLILQRAADNKNVKIRQEVIKGLIPIGGKKAAGLLGKFLKDEDSAVQMMAIRAFTEIREISADDTKPLMLFLSDRPFNKKDQALTLEAIKALEKAGGPAAEDLLKGYTKVRWWRSRKLQVERKEAALKAIAKIKRRQGIGGSARP